jgi:hypothetical protein
MSIVKITVAVYGMKGQRGQVFILDRYRKKVG